MALITLSVVKLIDIREFKILPPTISDAPVVRPHVDRGVVDVVQGMLRRKVLAGAGRPVLRGAVTGPGVEGDPGASFRPEALLPAGHLSGKHVPRSLYVWKR